MKWESNLVLISSIFILILLFVSSGLAYPQWSQNATSITNNTKYNPSNNYGFEINWTDDEGAGIIDSVIFETNLSSGAALENFTTPAVTNTTIDVFYINFTGVQTAGAGTYAYKWYANNTTAPGFWNSSDQLIYVIAQGSTNISLYLNGSEDNATYATNQIANFTALVNVSGLPVNLTSNYTGFVQQDGTTSIVNYTTLSISGNWWNLTAWTDGNANYSSSSQTYFFNSSTLANGQACSANSQCTGGYCVNNICRSASTYCGDSVCDTGETCGSCPGDCGSCLTIGSGFPPTTTPTSDIKIYSISAGSTRSVTISKDVGIKQMNITVKNSVGGVSINITKTTSLPSSVTGMTSGNTYQYIKIDKNNIDDSDVDTIKMKIVVEKSWIENNNIDDSTVALYRWSNGQWVKLPTSKVSETESEIIYEAETPGLSVFAINGETLGFAQQCPSCPQPSAWSDCVDGEHTRTNYKCDTTTNYKCESFTETQNCLEGLEDLDMVTITIIILVVLGIAAYFLFKFKKVTLPTS